MQSFDSVAANSGIPLSIRGSNFPPQEKGSLVKQQMNHDATNSYSEANFKRFALQAVARNDLNDASAVMPN
jgi:hypothetical protein